MMHFVGIDGFQCGDRLGLASLGEQVNHPRRHVQPSRLEDHGHHGQPPHQVSGGISRRPPHAGMGGQGAVMAACGFKAIAHQVEMLGFLISRFDPVVVISQRKRHICKPGDQVPMQVHRVQFDMGHRVQQRDPAQGGPRAAAGHIAGRQKFGGCGPGRLVGWAGAAKCYHLTRSAGRLPAGGMLARQRGFGATIGGGQHLHRHLGQCQGHNARTAANTSSTCPGTLTLRQMRAIFPVPSIRNVARSIPM